MISILFWVVPGLKVNMLALWLFGWIWMPGPVVPGKDSTLERTSPIQPNRSADLKQRTWIGTASVYAPKFQGRRTASGAIYDSRKLSAAHKTMPLGTKVKVIHLKNQCSVELIINDRLSRKSPHLIDLSPEAARQIEIPAMGIGKVRLERLSP